MSQQHLSLYITREQPCSYYDDRLSANLIPDPQLPMSAELYSLLIARGFRRSGEFVYRPHCQGCAACVPARINVSRFHPSRNQRRCLKRNADLCTRLVTARYTEEYFALYQRYLNTRHDDGSMANPQPEDFSNFLLNSWQSTLFIESRLQGKLLAVAVVDFLQAGPSAVYTFLNQPRQIEAWEPLPCCSRYGWHVYISTPTSTWATGSGITGKWTISVTSVAWSCTGMSNGKRRLTSCNPAESST